VIAAQVESEHSFPGLKDKAQVQTDAALKPMPAQMADAEPGVKVRPPEAVPHCRHRGVHGGALRAIEPA